MDARHEGKAHEKEQMNHGTRLKWADPPGYREAVERWKAQRDAIVNAERAVQEERDRKVMATLQHQAAQEAKVRKKHIRGPMFDVCLPSESCVSSPIIPEGVRQHSCTCLLYTSPSPRDS